MTVETKCPHCGSKKRVSENDVGRTVYCPTCQRNFTAVNAASPQAGVHSPGLRRIGGIIIALLGIGLSGLTWKTALNAGHFFRIGAACPGLALVGLALVVFPGYREERIARGEDISLLSGWELLTMRWRIVTIVAVIVVGFNYIALLKAIGNI